MLGSRGPTATTTTAPETPTTNWDTETTTTTAAPPNERGAIPKKLGEEAGWTDDSDDSKVSFAIDKITVDSRCDEYGEKPKGHTVVLDIRITTGEAGDALDAIAATINPYSFQVIGSDGVSKPAEEGLCKPESLTQLPTDYGPHQKYRGQIELDVPAKSGILVLAMSMEDITGWEWRF